MPTKPLPANLRLNQLKHQAKDLLTAHRARALDAIQRIREFHPRFHDVTNGSICDAPFKLSDAQLTIAREYGFPSWPRLKTHIENPDRDDLRLSKHERIKDAAFKIAVDLLDSGNATGLRSYLRDNPDIVRRRVAFDGDNYFTRPTLLEFVAENPTRHGTLPQNIVEIAKIILDTGGRDDRSSVDAALPLVSSSSVARTSGAQLPLIDLLCRYGADPKAGIYSALLYGEFESVNALLALGAKMDLVVAAAMGRYDDANARLSAANDETRQKALALAAQYGHLEIVRLLLGAGVDPNRYSPPGFHSHATPLHQAALAGHDRVVRLLVESGARVDIQDIHYNATALGWAEHSGHTEIAAYLRSPARGAGSPAHDEHG